MTLKERMIELIKHGAAITLHPPYPDLTLTLAGALWLDDPSRLRWSAIFPEHQGHIHETPYDEVELENDGRDIAFYADGRRVAGVVPYEERTLPVDEVRDALAEWHDLLGKHNNKANFEEFLRDA